MSQDHRTSLFQSLASLVPEAELMEAARELGVVERVRVSGGENPRNPGGPGEFVTGDALAWVPGLHLFVRDGSPS